MTENSLFENWKHCVGISNSKGVVLTKEMLYNWAETDGRIECASCGTVYHTRVLSCRYCNDYKHLQPYIAEWSESNE